MTWPKPMMPWRGSSAIAGALLLVGLGGCQTSELFIESSPGFETAIQFEETVAAVSADTEIDTDFTEDVVWIRPKEAPGASGSVEVELKSGQTETLVVEASEAMQAPPIFVRHRGETALFYHDQSQFDESELQGAPPRKE